MLIEVFRTIVFFEWILFILSILLMLTILLYIVKRTSAVDRLIQILLWGLQKRSIADIKESILKTTEKLKIAKVNVFISSVIVISSLLGLWFLIKKEYTDVLLPSDIFLLSILAILPLPFVILFFEYYMKKVSEKIEELAHIEEIKS